MKILIVEDEFVNRILLAEFLEPLGVCHQAADGMEGVKAFKMAHSLKEPYDLVCLDIMMPNLDGQGALEKIRTYEKEKGIGGSDMVKVVMTTALGDPQNIMKALVKGSCDGYLIKPITKQAIFDKLKEIGLIEEDK